MATAEAVREDAPSAGRVDRFGAWLRWWLVGTPLDWGFVALGTALIAAGYFDAWLNRNAVPIPSWEHAPTQAAWAAVTLYLATWAFIGLRQGRSLDRAVPESYGTAVVGSVVFLAGMVLDVWWRNAFGQDHGVPAIFRPTNLLQIGGAALMVTGPLRASVGRGELMAGPTAVLSAALLLAAVTFFTQFNHPYIDDWARGFTSPTFPNNPLAPGSDNPLDVARAQELAALGLMMQTAAVSGVILWTLRQTRLPVGSITLMLRSECADDLAALVRVLDLGPVIVVGYSLGGLVAQLFARRYPELVAGMVLCATASTFDVPTSKPLLRLVELAARRAPERVRRAAMMAMLAPKSANCDRGRWLIAQVRRHDTVAMLDAAAEAGRFNSAPWLGESACPAAVIVTSDDPVVSTASQREMSNTLVGSAVYEVVGDHFACIKRPAQFNAALMSACVGLAA